MSIQAKAVLFAIAFAPSVALAGGFTVAEEDPTYSRLYPTQETVEEKKDMVADINEQIENEPTAAGGSTHEVSNIYGLDFSLEHDAN